jgi:hypothetical protein
VSRRCAQLVGYTGDPRSGRVPRTPGQCGTSGLGTLASAGSPALLGQNHGMEGHDGFSGRRMRNADWLVGQIGLRSSARTRARSMLLEPSELPGPGWVLLQQRRWRVGMKLSPTEEERRARRVRSVIAIRSFEQRNASRWTWVRVETLASEQDAASYMTHIRDQLVPDPRAKRPLVEDRTIENIEIPGFKHPCGFEFSNDDHRGSGVAWAFAGHISHVVLLAQCSFYNDSWSWRDASSTIALQVEKIRSSIGAAPPGSPTT